MGTVSFPGIKCGRGVLLTTHPFLVPRSWKSRAIPLPTLWATPGLWRENFIYHVGNRVEVTWTVHCTVSLIGGLTCSTVLVSWETVKGKAMWIKRNAEGLSCNKFRSGKAIRILLYSWFQNFRRVLNAVCFLLVNSPASEFYMPTFRNTLFHPQSRVPTYLPMKVEHTECSETSEYKIQTPGN